MGYQAIVRRHIADRAKIEAERAVQFHTDILISELVPKYIEYAELNYRKNGEPTGQVHIIKAAIRTLREGFGDLEAREFGPKGLKAVRADFVAQGLCRNEVNRRTSLIRGPFRWAVSEELVPASAWQGLQAVSGLQRGRTVNTDRKPWRATDRKPWRL
jgi:hypothetical protein